MTWLGLGLLLALGAPPDGLSPVARDFYARAETHEARGELERAAVAYRMVWRSEPGWTQALIDEARVLLADERPEAALQALDRARYDGDVLEARGRILLQLGRSEQAADAFRSLPPEWPGRQLWVATALTAHDPVAAHDALLDYLGEPEDIDEEAVGKLAVPLAEALWDLGEEERAWAVADAVLQHVQDVEVVDALQRLRRERDVALQAERLMKAAALPLSPTGVLWLGDARERLHAGDVAGARSRLAALTEAEPRAATAWSLRSVAEERAGNIDEAVQAARRAEQLNPVDADASARVGDLLARHYGGRLDVQARWAYERAVQARGSDAGLWFAKAELERRTNRLGDALASYRRVLALAPGSPQAAEAEVRIGQLERDVPPEVPPIEGDGGRPTYVPESAWRALHVAWAWQRRAAAEPDALDRARASVEEALAEAPTWTRAINLDAAIRLDQGDDAAALARYRESLQLDPEQGAVWLVVGALLRQRGDEASALAAEERAAALGEPEAVLALAERRLAAWRLWDAHQQLQRYRARSVDAPERVDALEQAVRVRVGALAAAGAGGALTLVAVPAVAWRRRRSGVGLDAVLARDARAFPEVARILAAIRHEVIKHHTTVLGAVADALEDGDDGPAEWAEERLYGAEGAVPAFYRYLGELEALAERQGLRLNLRHADPELAPVVAAMDALLAAQGRLAQQAPEHLRALARDLNGAGYRALGRRVRELCQQRVDDAFVDEAWALACRELGDACPFERSVDDADGPLVVRMFRQDLLDVLVNVLRNAVQANESTGGGRVGVFVEVEDDWVTGLERVVIQVRDDSTLRLTTSQLRGRFLGRGLGLAVDRVTQAGGSMHVEQAPGWAKAVAIRLPRLETEGANDVDAGPAVEA